MSLVPAYLTEFTNSDHLITFVPSMFVPSKRHITVNMSVVFCIVTPSSFLYPEFATELSLLIILPVAIIVTRCSVDALPLILNMFDTDPIISLLKLDISNVFVPLFGNSHL